MKIDPPEAGKKVDLHRRCWVGRGGSTPSSCVRLSSSDLGYEGTDLELVVPKGTNKWVVGMGMVPRGEVGLIFAGIGKGLGVVDAEMFSVIIIMVLLTTLVTPPLLKMLLDKQPQSASA